MMQRLVAEPFTKPLTHHGEGPVWLDNRGLAVLDMLDGDVVLIGEDGDETERHHVDTVIASLRARTTGGFVVGTERGFALLDEDFSLEERIDCWTDATVRMNEGTVDPSGRFWCGSMAYDLTPEAGALWRLDADWAVTQVVEGIGCSNGLAWTPDGTAAFYVDSLTNRIDRLDFSDAGDLLGREPFVDVAGEGFPDGLTLDSAGGLWLALFGAGRLLHFDRYGNRDAEIVVPVNQVTSCAFGGRDFSRLYITTSRYSLAQPEPLAGAVFVVEPDAGGFGSPAFAG